MGLVLLVSGFADQGKDFGLLDTYSAHSLKVPISLHFMGYPTLTFPSVVPACENMLKFGSITICSNASIEPKRAVPHSQLVQNVHSVFSVRRMSLRPFLQITAKSLCYFPQPSDHRSISGNSSLRTLSTSPLGLAESEVRLARLPVGDEEEPSVMRGPHSLRTIAYFRSGFFVFFSSPGLKISA